jgi:5-methylthioadenosine/S-adenosylhomocysteine deaminase
MRGYADDMPLKQWLGEKIWPVEAKLRPIDIKYGTKIACAEIMASGTTTFNNMYWQPAAEIQVACQSGLRDFVGLVALEAGVNFGPDYIEKVFKKLKTQTSKKIKLVVAPHSIYTVKEKTLIWCRQFADKNNLLLHIHLSETEKEVSYCLKKHHCRPVEYLEKIGFLTPPSPPLNKGGSKEGGIIAAHVCWLSDKEIKILAKRRVSIVHCPTSNLKLASGVMPLTKLLNAGVNVCLGTDGPASNNSLDMFSEMKIAALIHKWHEKNPTAAKAQTILDIATINGARALKMEKEIGSLEIGKYADIIILNFNEPHLTPCFNPISHLVYAANGADVKIVIIGGQKVLLNLKVLKGKGGSYEKRGKSCFGGYYRSLHNYCH